jgi:hypothetical protein
LSLESFDDKRRRGWDFGGQVQMAQHALDHRGLVDRKQVRAAVDASALDLLGEGHDSLGSCWLSAWMVCDAGRMPARRFRVDTVARIVSEPAGQRNLHDLAATNS